MLSKAVLALAVAVAALAGTAEAACHKSCNGHGTCAFWDRCSCYNSFSYEDAEDCSKRICPQGVSWGSTSAAPHDYSECSSRGTCDRSTGQCECFDGHTGSACQRSVCSNSCSGNGVCTTLRSAVGALSATYAGWDTLNVQSCDCDPGFTGADCSLRKCPRGDDLLSDVVSGVAQANEVQTCTISGTSIVGSFSLKFTDWTGQSHMTKALWLTGAAPTTALQIQEALQKFPNGVIDTVDVAVLIAASATGVSFTVTFSSARNAGPQNLITVHFDDETAAGHNPLYGFTGGASLVGACTKSTVGTEESKVCAGRGSCDNEKGVCTCHSGFTGRACQIQQALI